MGSQDMSSKRTHASGRFATTNRIASTPLGPSSVLPTARVTSRFGSSANVPAPGRGVYLFYYREVWYKALTK